MLDVVEMGQNNKEKFMVWWVVMAGQNRELWDWCNLIFLCLLIAFNWCILIWEWWFEMNQPLYFNVVELLVYVLTVVNG
jgi:hypothetical protein